MSIVLTAATPDYEAGLKEIKTVIKDIKETLIKICGTKPNDLKMKIDDENMISDPDQMVEIIFEFSFKDEEGEDASTLFRHLTSSSDGFSGTKKHHASEYDRIEHEFTNGEIYIDGYWKKYKNSEPHVYLETSYYGNSYVEGELGLTFEFPAEAVGDRTFKDLYDAVSRIVRSV